MRRLLWAAAVGAALAAAGAPAARADIIHTLDGEPMEGEIVREDAREVELAVPGGRVRVPRNRILKIERSAPRRKPDPTPVVPLAEPAAPTAPAASEPGATAAPAAPRSSRRCGCSTTGSCSPPAHASTGPMASNRSSCRAPGW